MNIWFAEPKDRADVEALALTDKIIKDFKFSWTRWGHWESGNYPIVLENEQRIIGFHAAVYNKRNGYVNSYYQFTHPDYRGQGWGAAMVDFLLFNAYPRNCVRLKFQVPIDSVGQAFWQGFGLIPFGRSKTHLFFDVDISGVSDVIALTQLKPSKCFWNGIPETRKKRYRNAELTIFNSGDRGMLEAKL